MSMSISIASDPHIANSVRLIFAMFRLAVGIEIGFGKALLDILKQQFPDQKVDADPTQVGHKMMNIALKELQRNPADAMDSIQDWLTYISVGYGGDPKNPQPYPFDRDHDTWQEALRDAYSNLRKRSISKSRQKFEIRKEKVIDPTTGEIKEVERQVRREKGIEEAFGRRTEEGKYEKAEERIPTPEIGDWASALDDKAAIKEFMDLVDAFVPELIRDLPYDQRVLFDLIFEQGVGTFESDIKANMAQASELKKVVQKDAESDDPEIARKAKEVLDKHSKRWSGFVGDTRKRLLNSIQTFVEKYLPEHEYDILWDTFFADISPREVEIAETRKVKEKEEYQRGIDLRKLGRLKWKEEHDTLTKEEKKSYERLEKKLEKAGVDIRTIKSLAPGEKPSEEEEAPKTQRMSPAELRALSKAEEEEGPPTLRMPREEREPLTQRLPATASTLAMISRIALQSIRPKYL